MRNLSPIFRNDSAPIKSAAGRLRLLFRNILRSKIKKDNHFAETDIRESVIESIAFITLSLHEIFTVKERTVNDGPKD